MATLEDMRARSEAATRKLEVLTANYELVSHATRALVALRKLEELDSKQGEALKYWVRTNFEGRDLRAYVLATSDLPSIPFHARHDTPKSEIKRLFRAYQDKQRKDEAARRRERRAAAASGPDLDEGSGRRNEGEESEVALDGLLRAMISEYGIPEEVILRKYFSYALVLRGSGASSRWNDEVDDHGLSIGAVTPDDVSRAHTDFHQAVLNRIKIALVSEGWLPVPGEEEER